MLIASGVLVPTLAAADDPAPGLATIAGQERVVIVDPRTNAATARRALAYDGVPIRGAFETVRLDAHGGRRIVAARRPLAPPQLAPRQVRIDPASLPMRVADALDLADVPQPATAPELVYILVLDQPVLAWEMDLPLTLLPEPTHLRVWMSAATGRLLREDEQVFASRARIFPENPGKTPDPIEIELTEIDVAGPGFPLSGPRLRSLNCIDVEPDDLEPWWEEGECYPTPFVLSDANGDFFVTVPDIVRFEENVQGADAYAEVSMFAHADRFLAHMQTMGIDGFRCEVSTLLANFRDTEPSGKLPYSPLNNAYWTGECDPERGPTMLFGQGSEVDFGYDGDVIYHELGHGMVAHISPEGLTGRAMRDDGLLNDARALNEAFADYFSLMVTGDPELAEYVGRFWAANAKPYIRTAENERRCPDNTIGQEHNDSEPMTAALWAVRRRAVDPLAVDRMVLETLARLPNDATLDGAGQVMLQVADALVSEGVMAAGTVDLLVRALDARGMSSCPRVIVDPADVRSGRKLHLQRVTGGVMPFWPSPTQLRYTVPEGADDLVVQFRLSASKATDPIDGRVLVKRGSTPIVYTYDLVASDDTPDEPPEPGADPPDEVREVVLVRGDWDLELLPTRIAEDEYRVVLGGLQPGEVLHVTVVNAATASAVASDVRALSSNELAIDDESGSTDDGTGDDGPDEVAASVAAAGCACTMQARDRFPIGVASLPWLLLLGAARPRAGRRGRRS